MSIASVTETVVIDGEAASIVVENMVEAPELSNEALPENPPETLADLIRVLKADNCPSLTARSTLGYELGLKDESELYLRLVSNTGSGFFSKEWIACSLFRSLTRRPYNGCQR